MAENAKKTGIHDPPRFDFIATALHSELLQIRRTGQKMSKEVGTSQSAAITDERPVFSVITVVRNDPSGVAKTMRSVAAQGVRIEHILIDGASTDDTLATIRKHEKKFCKVISEPDAGIYDAMNKGLRTATGDWIIFMNAGDIFFDSGTLTSVSIYVSPETDVLLGETIVNFKDEFQSRLFHFKSKPEVDWWKGLPSCHQSIIYKRKALTQYPFDLQYEWCGDFDQFSRMVESNICITSIPVVISIFDGNSPIIRSPWQYIRERYRASKRFGIGSKRKVFFFCECLQVAIAGPVIALLRSTLPKNAILQLRRLRGTAGMPALPDHNSLE